MKSYADIARFLPPQTRKVPGGPLAPEGFIGGAVNAGIKSEKSKRNDLALIVSTEVSTHAAGTFTTNKVKAAPVRVSQARLRAGEGARAVVLNSGNANACTGESGLAAAREMAAAAASKADIPVEGVLVCSTGRIGVPLPVARIREGLDRMELGRGKGGGDALAHAIMTSDTFPKCLAVEVEIPGGRFRVGGMAKGAGMINPNMATMLSVITTDARIPEADLQRLLRMAVEDSFNRITVDGDMSTNDTVILLASGASKISPPEKIFFQTLRFVASELARMIVWDGEGVSRFVEVEVSGAASSRDARRAAEAVANSTLVKCAWAGGDPNWGRIMDALGYSGARMTESRVDIDYNGLPLARGGEQAPTPWKKILAQAAQPRLRVTVDLHSGPYRYEAWTTDLTEEYVRLNLGE